MTDKILMSREERFKKIQALSKNNKIVICLKANTPGIDKNRYSSFFLIRQLDITINESFQVEEKQSFDGFDGPYNLYIVEHKSLKDIKAELIHIEEKHPLGRLIDLDLYANQNMISRDDYNLSQRTCMLCDKPAFECIRNNTHSHSEVLSYIDIKIYIYIEEFINSIIEKAILKELNLENKFGLVTPSSNGSHDDMNYELMLESKDIIKPYLLDILRLGFINHEDDHLYQKARALGLKAELEMFEKTNQINTYKGLIYILGFVLLSIGYIIKNNLPYSDLFVRIKTLAKDVLEDFDQNVQTAGVNSYTKYQITGIRGEVFNGLPTIQKAQKVFMHLDINEDKHQHHLLLFFMIHSEDTVLLKRAGSLKDYQHYKQMAAQVNPYIDKDIINFTSYCIKHHISIGGSADLFIVFHFINYFMQFYKK